MVPWQRPRWRRRLRRVAALSIGGALFTSDAYGACPPRPRTGTITVSRPGRASLPMYDRPENAAAHDRFWQAVRAHLLDHSTLPASILPYHLQRGGTPWTDWTDAALILSQTCGLPFRSRLCGQVQLVCTPDYGLPDCPPGHYCSVIVMRADDDRRHPGDWPGLRLGVNDRLSQSGWAAALHHAQTNSTGFGEIVVTGSHVASAQSVATASTDIAFIDAQTWRMLAKWEDWSHDLHVIGQTSPTPGLPYITALGGHHIKTMRTALRHGLKELSPADRVVLGLRGMVDIPVSDYLAVPTPADGDEPGQTP